MLLLFHHGIPDLQTKPETEFESTSVINELRLVLCIPLSTTCLHFFCVFSGSWADRSPLHEAASQGRLLALRTLLAQVTGHRCEAPVIAYQFE